MSAASQKLGPRCVRVRIVTAVIHAAYPSLPVPNLRPAERLAGYHKLGITFRDGFWRRCVRYAPAAASMLRRSIREPFVAVAPLVRNPGGPVCERCS